MRKRFLIVCLITITVTSWGQRSNAPEYHKKEDDYLLRFGYYLGINQMNFKAEYSRYTLNQMEIQPQLGFNVGLFADLRILNNINLRIEPGMFTSPEVLTALKNSFLIAGSASIICGVLGLLIGYAVVRLPGTLISGFLRQISFLPYLMPGLAFAAAYLSLFAVARGPIPALYGSISLLILVMVVTYLPYASRSGISAMMQVGPEPEEAGMVLGAGFWRRIVSILAPLQKSVLPE